MGNGHVSRLLRLSRAGTLERLTISPHPRPSWQNGSGRIVSQHLGSAVQAQTRLLSSRYHRHGWGTAGRGAALTSSP